MSHIPYVDRRMRTCHKLCGSYIYRVLDPSLNKPVNICILITLVYVYSTLPSSAFHTYSADILSVPIAQVLKGSTVLSLIKLVTGSLFCYLCFYRLDC